MRYPDGGGLTAEQRNRREEVRVRGVDLFEEGVRVPRIARELRVSEKSVYQWRRAGASGGREALRSQGPRATTADSALTCRPRPPPGWTKGRRRMAGRMTRCGPRQGCAR
ncbi:helix-turn-helix domain-containing protein [Streptomyces sp. NPDC046931]|uniref:helix-turn-helix domain-containing protein n=1 Tax=Streptomyces sp. NPDC046931 TaxID=3154806 RepID=UPI0033E24B2E